MDSEESRREQSAGGSASHGGGKVCHRCGWVYPNPHPSRKQRAAHRKHCGAAGPEPEHGAVDATGAVDEEAPGRTGEVVAVDELKPEGGGGKAPGKSGGDGVELSKVVILDSDIVAVDNSSESHALHHYNEAQSSDEESTARQLVNSANLDNHSVTRDNTESCSLLTSTKESSINASDETSCATTKNDVDNAIVENNNITEGSVEIKSDLCLSESLILTHDSSTSSSATDAGDSNKYMMPSTLVDFENAVTTLTSGPHEDSANTRKPESFICGEVEWKTDDTTRSSEHELQIEKDACSYVNPNEPEHHQILPVGSGAMLMAASEVISESIENSGFESTVPSTFCARPESRSGLGGDIVAEIPNVVLSELLVAETDQNTNNVFPNVNERCYLKSSDDQYHRDEGSGNSQLANELDLMESISKFDCLPGEPDCFKTEKQIGSLVLSAEKAAGFVGEVTNSCKTCYSPTEFQDHDSHLYCEGTLADDVRNDDSAVTLPDVRQFSATPEISSKHEILSQEATQIDSEAIVDEERQELIEESFYVDPKIDSPPEDNGTELEAPFGYEYSDGISNSHFDQPHFQRTHLEICNASIDKIIEQPKREVEPLMNEAITENRLLDDHCNKLNIHEGETSNVEAICGSQQDPQKASEATNANLVSCNKNNLNPFTSGVDCSLNVEEGNSTPNILNKESNSKGDEVSLCHDGEGIPKTVECTTAVNEKMVSDCDSNTSDSQGDSSSVFYQYSKDKDVNEQIMQQVDSYTVKINDSIDLNHQSEQQPDPCTGKIDDSIDSNKQDGSIEAILSSISVASPRYAAIEGSNCDAKASQPPDCMAAKDLCISDGLLTAGALQRNSGEVEGSSWAPLLEPGQISMATANESILNSKDEEPQGRNISCDAKASLPTDCQARRDLYIFDDPSTVDDRNNSEFEGSGSVTPVENGQISISTEATSILNSKHEEPEGRNISCDAKASPSNHTQAIKDPCISDDPTGGAESDVRNNDAVEDSSLVPVVEHGQMSRSIETESILNCKDEEPEGRNFSFDAKVPVPTDFQTIKDLLTSDDPTAIAALPQSNVENNGKVEGSSLMPLVSPGRKSISIEAEAILDSKHEEPEGRNISEEPTAKMLSCNSGKSHVMLKNLLAEANTEGKQMNTNGQGHNASLSSKKSWDLEDGHSDKPKKQSVNQTDHKEWNSPARLPLPATKPEKKKSKGKQSWVPFICCPSIS